VNSALVLLDLALLPDVVVVLALLTVDPITVSGFIPVTVTIVIMLMLILMLDFPAFKLSEDLLDLSASLVPSILRALVPKLLSASSMNVVVPEAAVNLSLTLVVSLLSALRRVMFPFLVMLVSLTALIPLNTAALLVRRSALEDAWVEELATMVLAFATRDPRVRTVLKELN